MASVLGETLGRSDGFRHAIKGRVREVSTFLGVCANCTPVQFRDMTGNSRLIIDYRPQPTIIFVQVFRTMRAGAFYVIMAAGSCSPRDYQKRYSFDAKSQRT